ncbi:hypothetical protein ACFLV7_04125 [Chloroflexota bacterium]
MGRQNHACERKKGVRCHSPKPQEKANTGIRSSTAWAATAREPAEEREAMKKTAAEQPSRAAMERRIRRARKGREPGPPADQETEAPCSSAWRRCTSGAEPDQKPDPERSPTQDRRRRDASRLRTALKAHSSAPEAQPTEISKPAARISTTTHSTRKNQLQVSERDPPIIISGLSEFLFILIFSFALGGHLKINETLINKKNGVTQPVSRGGGVRLAVFLFHAANAL